MPARHPAGNHRVNVIHFDQGEVECACGKVLVLGPPDEEDSVMVRNQDLADLFADHRRAVAARMPEEDE
jgi:hypothetical protein